MWKCDIDTFRPTVYTGSPPLLVFFALPIEHHRSCWNAEPPLSQSSRRSFCTQPSQWRVPRKYFKKHQKEQQPERQKGRDLGHQHQRQNSPVCCLFTHESNSYKCMITRKNKCQHNMKFMLTMYTGINDSDLNCLKIRIKSLQVTCQNFWNQKIGLF